MKVQRIHLGNNQYSWIVLDYQFKSIEPVEKFIAYLFFTQKSPNTIKSYATHLKLFWQYLIENKVNWLEINISNLANFVHWLKVAQFSNVISFSKINKRMESTINATLSAVSSLYRYYNQLGQTDIQFLEPCNLSHHRYKSLLFHIHKHKPTMKRIISLKQPKSMPKTLKKSEVDDLLSTCANKRDYFLINLLYETGMRIGEALSLWHEDIKSWDNEIHITPREHYYNSVIRTKSKNFNIIHVSPKLMKAYSDYVLSHIESIKKCGAL